ncbi:MAG: EscU/YscU/HrcU family type III secretion system export apparatus switch protein, partial [Lachnospiraceae bacterium]|nr:EscU/YscU/HrcU family type III secretion system export apparatus switch protein [Lachnospiraceae bacterium]
MSGERLLYLNLQFFAKDGPGGEKTEEPTGKKLEDARKEGQVAKSMELNSSLSLLAVFTIIRLWGVVLATNFTEMIRWIYSNLHNFRYMTGSNVEIRNFVILLNTVILRMMLMLLPVFAVGFIVAFIVNVVQVKWKVTTKPLQPKLSKFNPIDGMKGLFSKEKLF